MRIRALLALLATGFLAPAPVRAAGEPLRLETPPKVDALKVVDVDGDGRPDVVTLSSRTVCVWLAGQDAAPTSAPKWKVDLPLDVSFVDVSRAARPSLLCLGAEATSRTDLATSKRTNLTESGLGWRDGGKAIFAPLHPNPMGPTGHLALQPQGWVLVGSDGVQVEFDNFPARAQVTPPGSFLEDVGTCVTAVPNLVGRIDARALDLPLWSVNRWGLTRTAGSDGWMQSAKVHHVSPGVVSDLAFLPTSGECRLEHLGGGVPALIHRDGDNREVRYAVFRQPGTRTLANGTEVWVEATDIRPPAAYLRLAGYNLDPDYVDVDGDGLVDFVVTTMALDGPNIFRAVATGKVTATTLAFLQRRQAPNVPMFPTQPDAVVTSEIGVKIRFAHTGTIDVSRSFTILSTGDLDGDGRKDLVIRSGPSTLQVRKGAAEGVWAKDATTVTIPAVGPGEECEATAANLDGKPGDEILLLYRGADTAPDRLYVLKP